MSKRPELQVPWDDDAPHGWVQWKGTDVCMDVHCTCGALFHVDGDFCYAVRCRDCGQAYAVNGNVRLHPVDEWDGCKPLEDDSE